MVGPCLDPGLPGKIETSLQPEPEEGRANQYGNVRTYSVQCSQQASSVAGLLCIRRLSVDVNVEPQSIQGLPLPQLTKIQSHVRGETAKRGREHMSEKFRIRKDASAASSGFKPLLRVWGEPGRPSKPLNLFLEQVATGPGSTDDSAH